MEDLLAREALMLLAGCLLLYWITWTDPSKDD
jgi:hypothetical protein